MATQMFGFMGHAPFTPPRPRPLPDTPVHARGIRAGRSYVTESRVIEFVMPVRSAERYADIERQWIGTNQDPVAVAAV